MTDPREQARLIPPDKLPAFLGVLAEAQAIAQVRLIHGGKATPLPVGDGAPNSLVVAAVMAERIGMSVFWLRDRVKALEIPAHRIGRRLLFDPAEVVAAVKALEVSKAGRQDQRSWAHRDKKRPKVRNKSSADAPQRTPSVQPSVHGGAA